MSVLLAVDVGNTNTVLGVFRDDVLAASWRIQTVAERTSDEYAVLVKTLLDMEGFPWQSIEPTQGDRAREEDEEKSGAAEQGERNVSDMKGLR